MPFNIVSMYPGLFFVTICTKNRDHYFGEITNGEMNLSGIGIIADIMWYEIKNHAKNVELDAFVVMPNHIHGIIIINKPYQSFGVSICMAITFS